jgi:hypothetical protein
MNYQLKTQAIALIGADIRRIFNNFSAKEIGSLRNSFKHTHTHTHTHTHRQAYSQLPFYLRGRKLQIILLSR